MPSQRRKLGDTRRQREAKVFRTFGPIYKFIEQLRADQVDAVRGYPMIEAWGEYMQAGDALIGFMGCMARLSPTWNAAPVALVAAKLDKGVPLTLDEVSAFEDSIRDAETVYRSKHVREIKDAFLIEQIAIELEDSPNV